MQKRINNNINCESKRFFTFLQNYLENVEKKIFYIYNLICNLKLKKE